MSQKLIIIYDCPLNTCDKLWVKTGLEERGYHIKVVAPCLRISQIEQRGSLGKLAARIITMWQSIKGLVISKPGELIFCWSQWSGLLLNQLPGAKSRRIISYNWLTPIQNSKTVKLYKEALENPNFTAIVNSSKTKTAIIKSYQVEKECHIEMIPDVFDNKEPFQKPVYKKGVPYCFTGGRANRDWKLICELAKSNPTISFIGVAAASDWDQKLKIPKNLEMRFDLSPTKYYDLLKGAYLSIYPLKDDRVSGLINILKSIQFGVPVFTTDLEAASMYFGSDSRMCLIEPGNVNQWIDQINIAFGWERERYEKVVLALQQYIIKTFSPETAINKIVKIIQNSEWEVNKNQFNSL